MTETSKTRVLPFLLQKLINPLAPDEAKAHQIYIAKQQCHTVKKNQLSSAASFDKKTVSINKTALLSWISVLFLTVTFWSGVAMVCKEEVVPRTFAKLQQKEQKFLTNHKGFHKKVNNIISIFS